LSGAGEGAIERILIVRLSAMGDVLHTLPAVEALRAAFPRAMIGWLIDERWVELLCAPGTPLRGPRSAERPLVDWVHPLNRQAWAKSWFSLPTLEQVARAWNDVRWVGYDIAIDLQGAIRSALLAAWSGARIIYGAADPREAPASLCYSRRVVTRGAHVIEQNLSLVEAVLGKTLTTAPPVELPHDAGAEQRMQRRLAEMGGSDFVLANPGAGWGAKRWPAERYGQVARRLGELGLRTLVNCGPGEETLAREVEAAAAGAACAIQTSISELAALTRRAKLFLGGDTGPLHLAAALGIPVVAIFGPTDPARNGPYRTPSRVVRNPESRTTYSRQPRPDEALLEISVDTIVEAARELLASRGGQSAGPAQGESAHG
jgi:heptosyltransferase I